MYSKKEVELQSAKEQSEAKTSILYKREKPAFAPEPLTVITGAIVFALL